MTGGSGIVLLNRECCGVLPYELLMFKKSAGLSERLHARDEL